MAAYDITEQVAELLAGGYTPDQVRALHDRVQEQLYPVGSWSASNRQAESAIRNAVAALRAGARKSSGTSGQPEPTYRQVAYLTSLGGTYVAGMSRTDVSAEIDRLKGGRGPAAAAQASGRRHGVRGEVWD